MVMTGILGKHIGGFWRVGLLLFVMLLAFGNTSATAQTLPSAGIGSAKTETRIVLPDPLTPEAVRGLVSTLSDQQVRTLLLERLDAVAKEKQQTKLGKEVGVGGLLESWIGDIAKNFVTAVVRIPLIWEGLKTSTSNFVDKHGTLGIFKLFGLIIAALIAGLIAEYFVNYLTRNRRKNAQSKELSDTLVATLKVLGGRLFWDLIALFVFFAVTRIVIRSFVSDEFAPLVSLFMVQMVVYPRYAWAFSRFLTAPENPKLRLINATDEVARYFHRTTIGVVLLMGFSSFIIGFHLQNGVEMGETRLGYWLSGALFVWIIVAMYRAREGVTNVVIGPRPEEVTPTEMRMARGFPWFAIVLTILMWFVVEIIASMGRFDLLGGRQYIVLILIIFSPAFDTAIRGLVRHLVPPMEGDGIIARQAYSSAKRCYIRIGRAMTFAVVILIIAGLWGIDFENLASAGVGARFAAGFLEMLMVLATGYLVWELVTLLFNRKLAAEQTADGFEPGAGAGGEGGGQGGSRLSTVLPMISLTVQVAIVVVTVLIALSSIGVDTTPLLAGAGIVGLAIGFGAQALVKDVVAGIFFLVDDAFRVGEYLVIGTTVGTVEKISLRSLQLRHHKGPVHTIPFGEMHQVTNNSRDWVIVKIKFTVPFGTDTNKIKKLFKVIGAEMKEAPYAGDLLQTFKSQGVYDVDDVGIVIRGKFMAKPGTQWIIRKDVFTRVQKVFEENGIEFARKEVKVQIPGLDGSKELTSDQKKAVSAAASEAAETTPKPA